jgi:uncharacterized protein YejL (UPF0352 family)
MPESSATTPVTRADIERLEKQLADMKAAIERHDASLKLGLKRMGQLQADIDLIRAAWSKVTPNKT